MIGLLIGLLLVSCLFGRTRALLGSLAGGFLGALVLVGMARTAAIGELPALYSPAELASSVVPVLVVAAVLALVAPYAIEFASFGWGAGALLAAVAAPRTGDAAYMFPLVLHAGGAAIAGWLARARIASL